MASFSRVSPAFFKVMIDDFRTQLKIPRSFSCEMAGEEMGNAELTSYKGSWEVEVGKCGEHFRFEKGWTEFVDYHNLVEGDFVVFQHNGNLRFDCVLFGQSACEKRLSSSNKRGKAVKKEEVDSDPELSPRMMRAYSFGNPGKQPTAAAAPPPPPQISPPTTSNGRPSFTATIRPSNSSRSHPYMSVPVRFWRANEIITEQRYILLRDPLKRCWPVDLQYYPGISRLNLGQGWHEFFQGNKLKEGDVCTFELNPRSPEAPNIVLDVLIFPL